MPSPKVEVVDFYAALKLMVEGKNVTKLEWADKQFYGCIHFGRLTLHKPDGKFYEWIVGDGDILGQDWLVVDNLGIAIPSIQ